MSGLLDKQEIEIPCDKCGRKTKKSIGWIKTHSEYVCGCGTTIKLDTRQFKSEIAEVERSFANLQRVFKKSGK